MTDMCSYIKTAFYVVYIIFSSMHDKEEYKPTSNIPKNCNWLTFISNI